MSNNESIRLEDSQDLKNANLNTSSALMNLNTFLIGELEDNLSINLSDDLKNLIKTNIGEYEQVNLRKLEEKDLIISQLKQNLVDLTEKRFRTSVQNGTAMLPMENIEFLLNEKEARVNQLLDELSDKSREISKLKDTIKTQDDVILSHNNNIFELKNTNQSVLKAKQESFRVMTDDLTQKQKLIDEQTETIRELREKVENLKQENERIRLDLEKRLNDKEIDLQIKIAHFEANLHEGKQYFEEILNEKTNEINRLKQKLGESVNETTNEIETNTTTSQTSIHKFDSENIKNIKSLYEHQIDILKVKIEMLEKTCSNYQQGIKEMNKNFGIQQLSDEANSIQIFKDLMQDLQKTNVRLETEKIDLEVNNSKLQSQLEQTKIEKENLNKKFQQTDQINQRLVQEKLELDSHYRSLIVTKDTEILDLNQRFTSLNTEYERLRDDNIRLGQISLEYDQLKITNEELTGHYEKLYQQATDIVNGNQLLNEQVQTNELEINDLKSKCNDLQLQVDHLTNCNSELNTQKINYEIKSEALEQEVSGLRLNELKELELLRGLKLDTDVLNQKLKELQVEVDDKNELIDQLNQAKEFLAENNSKLLTNNIKIQLFIESLGLDTSEIESNQKVKEYDELVSKVEEYQTEILGLRIKLEESIQTEKSDKWCQFERVVNHDKETQFDSMVDEINELKTKLSSTEKLSLKMKAKLKQLLKNTPGQTETKESQTEKEEPQDLEFLVHFGARIAQENIEKDVMESLRLLQDDLNLLLLSRKIKKSDKSLNTSQDFDYRDQIINLECQLNEKLQQVLELKQELNDKNESLKSGKSDWGWETENQVDEARIQMLEDEIGLKDDRIKTLEGQIKDLDGLRLQLDDHVSNQRLETIARLEEAISLKDDQLKTLEGMVETFRLEIDDLKNSQVTPNLSEQRQETITQLEEVISLKEDRVKALEGQVKDLEGLVETLRVQIDDLQKAQDTTDLIGKIIQLEETLSLKDDQLKALQGLVETFRLEKDHVQDKIVQLEEALGLKDEQIKTLEGQIKDLDGSSDNIAQLQEALGRIKTLEDQVSEDQNLVDTLKTQIFVFENELSVKNDSIMTMEQQIFDLQETRKIENVQALKSNENELNERNHELIELKARVDQLLIDLSIKNDQLTNLETILNEHKISGQKLNDESEGWKKKYEQMRLKALALKDKCKKYELSHQLNEECQISPGNSSKSSMDSSSLVEHLFHNLQAEYKEFKKSHDDDIKELNNRLGIIRNEYEEYKANFNQDKISEIHKMYCEQLKMYETNFGALQTENDELKEMKTKMTTIEKQNLKLKAKLKQVLKSEKEGEVTKEVRETQTEDNFQSELEMLKLKNEDLKTLIDDLEKNQVNDHIKTELNELKDKLKLVQDQNLKLKAKLKQVISSHKVQREDFECQTEIGEFENLLSLKQKMNDDLITEIRDLKSLIDQQRVQYEEKINNLNVDLSSKEASIIQISNELNGLRSQSEISICVPMMSESMVMSEVSNGSSSNLESQLKFCHEKCEKVVAKLMLLRKQNESLNTKIKTIKSMIVS